MGDVKTTALAAVAVLAVATAVILSIALAAHGPPLTQEVRKVTSLLKATQRRLALLESGLAGLNAFSAGQAGASSAGSGSPSLERLDVPNGELRVILNAVQEVGREIAPWRDELAALTATLVGALNASMAEWRRTSGSRLDRLERAMGSRVRVGGAPGGVSRLDKTALPAWLANQEATLRAIAANTSARGEALQARLEGGFSTLETAASALRSDLSSLSRATLAQLKSLRDDVSNATAVLRDYVVDSEERARATSQLHRSTNRTLHETVNALAEVRNNSGGRLPRIEQLVLRLSNFTREKSEATENQLRSLNASVADLSEASERNQDETLQRLDEMREVLMGTWLPALNATAPVKEGDKEGDKEEKNGTLPIEARASCEEYKENGFNESGVYRLSLKDGLPDFDVFCDMKTGGKAWVVIQRRKDGSVDFYRNWTDYKEGFGNLTGEFWLGNDKIHRLTASGLTRVRFDLEKWGGDTRYAEYSKFTVAGLKNDYRVGVSGYSGTAGDGMKYHDGRGFSTKDKGPTSRCARSYTGAWWYKNCHHVNLNGHYYKSNPSPGSKGVNWRQWLGYTYSLKATEMKLR